MRYLCRIFTDYLNQAQSNVSLRHVVSNGVTGKAKRTIELMLTNFCPYLQPLVKPPSIINRSQDTITP